MSGLVGQGYDGASSSRNGVQAKVAEKYPNARYVHCRSHVLNLAISSGCKAVQSIQNLFNVSKLSGFLVAAPKRKKHFFRQPWPLMTMNCWALQLHVLMKTNKTKKTNLPKHWKREASKRLYRNCASHWSAKATTPSALLAKYGSVLLALGEISSSSSGHAKHDASAYSRLLQDSEFIVALTAPQFVLSFLAQVKSPQTKSCNLGRQTMH